MILFVIEPPAVGKTSVAQAIAKRTGLRLFHNHIPIEVALGNFDYSEPSIRRISETIRQQIVT